MGLFDTFKRATAKASSGSPSSERKISPPPTPVGTVDSREHGIAAHSQAGVKQKLLFVGGAPVCFQSLADKITQMEPAWLCRQVENLEQAGTALKTESYLAVILSAELAGDSGVAAGVLAPASSLVRIGLYPAPAPRGKGQLNRQRFLRT